MYVRIYFLGSVVCSYMGTQFHEPPPDADGHLSCLSFSVSNLDATKILAHVSLRMCESFSRQERIGIREVVGLGG